MVVWKGPKAGEGGEDAVEESGAEEAADSGLEEAEESSTEGEGAGAGSEGRADQLRGQQRTAVETTHTEPRGGKGTQKSWS